MHFLKLNTFSSLLNYLLLSRVFFQLRCLTVAVKTLCMIVYQHILIYFVIIFPSLVLSQLHLFCFISIEKEVLHFIFKLIDRLNILMDNDQAIYKTRTLIHNLQPPSQETTSYNKQLGSQFATSQTCRNRDCYA